MCVFVLCLRHVRTCVQHKRQHTRSLVAFMPRSPRCQTTDPVTGRVTQSVRCTERERERTALPLRQRWEYQHPPPPTETTGSCYFQTPFLFAAGLSSFFLHSLVMSDSRGQAFRVPARHRWCADVVVFFWGGERQGGINVKALCGALSLCSSNSSSKRKLFIRTR